MDLSASIVPKSDQINADDLIAGPVTVTIADVRAGSDEQPINVITEEYGKGRAYRPSKSMRRIMVAAWGSKSEAYVGQRMTLYRDPSVRFGKDEVGGIKISHLSGIDGPLTVALTATRGKREKHTVQPVPTAAPKSDPQLSRLGSLLKAHGYAEPAAALTFCAAVIGRDDFRSSKELTPAEVAQVITELDSMGGDS